MHMFGRETITARLNFAGVTKFTSAALRWLTRHPHRLRWLSLVTWGLVIAVFTSCHAQVAHDAGLIEGDLETVERWVASVPRCEGDDPAANIEGTLAFKASCATKADVICQRACCSTCSLRWVVLPADGTEVVSLELTGPLALAAGQVQLHDCSESRAIERLSRVVVRASGQVTPTAPRVLRTTGLCRPR